MTGSVFVKCLHLCLDEVRNPPPGQGTPNSGPNGHTGGTMAVGICNIFLFSLAQLLQIDFLFFWMRVGCGLGALTYKGSYWSTEIGGIRFTGHRLVRFLGIFYWSGERTVVIQFYFWGARVVLGKDQARPAPLNLIHERPPLFCVGVGVWVRGVRNFCGFFVGFLGYFCVLVGHFGAIVLFLMLR